MRKGPQKPPQGPSSAPGDPDPGDQPLGVSAYVIAYASVIGEDTNTVRHVLDMIRKPPKDMDIPLDPLWPYLDKTAEDKDASKVWWLSREQATKETPFFMEILNGYAQFLNDKKGQ